MANNNNDDENHAYIFVKQSRKQKSENTNKQ